jgi:hypothetical protein
MNLKLKYAILIPLQSVIPFTLLICGPYVGLVPRTHNGRLVQIIGGALTIVLLGIMQYFLGYVRERNIRQIFADIRARGSRSVSVGGSVDVV